MTFKVSRGRPLLPRLPGIEEIVELTLRLPNQREVIEYAEKHVFAG